MFLKRFFNIRNFYFIIILSIFISPSSADDDTLAILEKLKQDVKTLEKAVYSQASANFNNTNSSLSNNDEDVLTRHLLKLSEIEQQFQQLTNKFEEINFQELEVGTVNNVISKSEKTLPGSSEPQDLGAITYKDTETQDLAQKTQSIETTSSVVTENFVTDEKILPKKDPKEQYNFATSLLKQGDYSTAERALREFVIDNPEHNLAGNAQYWYAETFRIRQLYTDAASAYLEGYQKYPKSEKAAINLLKLGVSLVQIGEKDQGCLMIKGVKKEYPKAKQSVLQKAKYEEKKFDCQKQSS